MILGTFKNGGEGEIRTLERVLAVTRFRVVRLQPLGHLSAEEAPSFRGIGAISQALRRLSAEIPGSGNL
jgi:hypothetical protein